MEKIESDVLVIGAGGAGMSAAAAAASSGASVAVVDDNPDFGGQIWRKGVKDKGSQKSESIIKELDRHSVRFLPSTTVVDLGSAKTLFATTPRGRISLRYGKLVIATGARERLLPFPGWTLPNVYGAGGLQALVKSGLDVTGKRIVIAGTGPLLIAVADYLRSKGADVLIVAEEASFGDLFRFGLRLAAHPGKMFQAAALKLQTRSVRFRTGSFLVEAKGGKTLESVVLKLGGRNKEFECDMLAAGFHLIPNLELPGLIGCRIGKDGAAVDKYQQTSVINVYAAGETTGIGGIELSCVEGRIAGHSAAGNRSAAENLFRQRTKFASFAGLLNRTFKLGDSIRSSIDESTLVCRCEDVSYGRLKDFDNWREAKLQTRCGMGPCQGRICGPAVNYLFEWEPGGIRPPIFPVKLGELGESE